MLRLADRFVWDFWTIREGGETWLYALTAPRDPDPETRHDRARVDVFRSRDLVGWTAEGVALAPGAPGAWDDLSIWTGSAAARPGGGWAMLYTGRSRADGGRVQRIGLAVSDDLKAWEKHPRPVLEADGRLYRRPEAGEVHWRDPWLARDQRAGLWRVWVTAQHASGDAATAGCLAVAESRDLTDWRLCPPATEERLAEVFEVPQVLSGGRGALVSVYPHHVPEGGRLPRACMTLLFREGGAGFVFDRVLEAGATDARYMLREVAPGVGLCWLGRDGTGAFLGAVSDPFPLVL